MASKSEKLLYSNLTKKQRKLAISEVCARNIYHLSNKDIKTLLSEYRSLSVKDKIIVRQFSTELQKNHHNRFSNLSSFFKQAYDSDPRVRHGRNTASESVYITETNNTNDVVDLTLPNNNTVPEVVINKPSTSTNNNSVAPYVEQESTVPPFHTNIISNRVSNNIVNINPFYSTIFPMIHQKVLNQCFSSVSPQIIMNHSNKNITTIFNFGQNINRNCVTVNKKINTIQKESPSKFQSEKSGKKITTQTSNKAVEKSVSKNPNSDPNKRNEITTNKNNGKYPQFSKGMVIVKDSRNQKQNQLKNNKKTADDNNMKASTTKNIPKNVSLPKSNSSIKIDLKSSPNSKISKESVTVQDLESFSMEHMKKIESFAQKSIKNSIKFNLSSNSQMKISETYSKKKQHADSKIINLTGIKPFYDDAEANIKNTQQIVKDAADKRLNECSTDNLKNDQNNVKPKVIKNSADVYTSSEEKCRSKSNDYQRKDAPSKSSFLDECNRLKSIISKNSNIAENSSKKSKKKRKKNKSKKQHEDLERVKLDDQSVSNETSIPEQKISLPEDKNISTEKDLIKENVEEIEVHNKKPLKREVKVVNRILRNDNPNDQIIKSISEKPFSEGCNKVTNDTISETKQDVKCKLDKTMDTEDLMVLLKYFYKLDGLEQHRLIEFLKELELTEPERVADLRKHVRTSPPEDEDTVLQNPQPEVDMCPVELDDRPESRNSDLSNIDLILEDIDSILNDEDNEEPSSNKDECTEPASKRLKTDLQSHELARNDTKCNSTVASFGKTIPVQFRNTQNFTFNQHSNNFTNSTPIIQYNNLMQQNINYISQCQNYGLNHQNQYFQNNLQQTYQLNATQVFIQNQCTGSQNQQNFNGFQEFQNFCYNYNNQVGQYQQNYSNYQNNGYFQ